MFRKYYKNNTLSTDRPIQKGCHVKFYLPKRSQYGKRASQRLANTSGKLESSSEMDKLPCCTKTALSPVTKLP